MSATSGSSSTSRMRPFIGAPANRARVERPPSIVETEETMTTGALAALAALFSTPTAHAFCGAYVGGVTTNEASIVVIARQGDTTTLTLVNDFGEAEGTFGYVMPVPEGTALEDVGVVDPAVIE